MAAHPYSLSLHAHSWLSVCFWCNVRNTNHVRLCDTDSPDIHNKERRRRERREIMRGKGEKTAGGIFFFHIKPTAAEITNILDRSHPKKMKAGRGILLDIYTELPLSFLRISVHSLCYNCCGCDFLPFAWKRKHLHFSPVFTQFFPAVKQCSRRPRVRSACSLSISIFSPDSVVESGHLRREVSAGLAGLADVGM